MNALRKKALIQIHLATVLLGFVALVVELIDASSLLIVFGRNIFEFVFLVLFVIIFRKNIKLNRVSDYFILSLLGLIQAVQWFTFFEAIKTADIALALLSLFTFPMFLALFEPLLFKEHFTLLSFILAIMILSGIVLIIPEFSFSNPMTVGILWGILSALSVTALMLISRKYVQNYSGVTISLYKSGISLLALLPLVFSDPVSRHLNLNDLLLFIVLGVALTGIPYVMVTESLKKVNTRDASNIISLEPVYGIIIASVYFRDLPELPVIAGGMLILGATFITTFRADYNLTDDI